MELFKKQPKAPQELKPLGIYVHVPFCRSKCEYCDFYSLGGGLNQESMDLYMEAVLTHIKEASQRAIGYSVNTVYFGGGTPSFFGADGLVRILAEIDRRFLLEKGAEITLEANPDTVSLQSLMKLRRAGFNRISIGVQSDDDAQLKTLGRPHTYAQAEKVLRKIRRFGFKNLSVDLMYGLPGQRRVDWERTLEHVLKHRPEHISCYGLKVEEGTPLANMQDSYNLPDDDTQADMYLAACEILRKHGYRQYEISNFCKKGLVSRHNLKYWTGGEYLGFGPDASSDFGGRRFAIVRDLKAYIEGIRSGGTVLRELQDVAPRERAGEYLMMRLRTTNGIDPKHYEKKLLLPFAPLEAELIKCQKNNLAEKTRDGRWRLTPEGFLVSNSIISDLLLLQERSSPLTVRFQ